MTNNLKFRILIGALAVGILSTLQASKAQAKSMTWLDFEGSYKLVRDVVGQCEPILSIHRQNDDENEKNLIVGQFMMRNIDGGTETYEDLFSKRRFTTTLRGNVIESRQTIWDKSYKRVEVRRYGIRKAGKRLSLWTYNNQTRALPIKCEYKFTSEEPIELPWDPKITFQ